MSSQGIHKPRAPRLVSALIAALIAVTAGVLLPAPAFAHDQLLGTDPAADSTVDALPAEITLTYSGLIDPDAGASVIEVTDAAGTSLVGGAPSIHDNQLTQPLDTTIANAAGPVTVLWKVVSSDGHPVSGQFSFTVPAGTGATPEPTETATASPTATPTPTQEAAPTSDAASAPPATGADTGLGPVAWALIIVVAAAVLGAVIYLLTSFLRPRKSGNDGGSPDANR